MKLKILFVLMLLLFSFGCTQVEETEEETLQITVIETLAEDKETNDEQFYTIRLTEYGPEPSYIEADLGTFLHLEVVNDMERDTRFIIYDYDVDERLEKLGVLDLYVYLTEEGEFDFGDETETIPKGVLVVLG